MVPRETGSFVFPRVLMFPKTNSRETSAKISKSVKISKALIENSTDRK